MFTYIGKACRSCGFNSQVHCKSFVGKSSVSPVNFKTVLVLVHLCTNQQLWATGISCEIPPLTNCVWYVEPTALVMNFLLRNSADKAKLSSDIANSV